MLLQLCYKNDCVTCGILAHGFNLSKSVEGSLMRGQGRVWQRFNRGIYSARTHPRGISTSRLELRSSNPLFMLSSAQSFFFCPLAVDGWQS